MRIGIDFGGVVANHLPTKMKLVRERFNLPATHPEEVTRAILLPQIGEGAYNMLVRDVGARTQEFEIFPYVKEVLTQLQEMGDTICMVSTQTNADELVLEDFMTRHSIPVNSVSVVQKDVEKTKKCQEIGVDLFLDDSIAILENLIPLNIPLCLALFSYTKMPKSDLLENKITPVKSWRDFLEVRLKYQ